jgi:hypothetical protein
LHQHDEAKATVLALYLEVVCGLEGFALWGEWDERVQVGDLSVVVVVKMKDT